MMDKLATIVRNALEQPAVIDTAATCMTSRYPTSFVVHLTRDGVQIGQPVEPNIKMYREMQVKMGRWHKFTRIFNRYPSEDRTTSQLLPYAIQEIQLILDAYKIAHQEPMPHDGVILLTKWLLEELSPGIEQGLLEMVGLAQQTIHRSTPKMDLIELNELAKIFLHPIMVIGHKTQESSNHIQLLVYEQHVGYMNRGILAKVTAIENFSIFRRELSEVSKDYYHKLYGSLDLEKRTVQLRT